MLGYKIRLKSRSKIEELCYTTDGGDLTQEGIGFNFDVLNINGFFGTPTLEKIENISDDLNAVIIKSINGAKIYVHLDWIASFDGSVTTTHKLLSDTMLQVSNKHIINPNTGELILRSTLPQCSSCDALGAIDMGDGTHLCTECNDHLTKPRNYTYRPDEFKFIGEQLLKDKETPVWYGLEVEIATDKEKLGKFMRKNNSSVYIKSDSSIEGSGHKVEVVSHPHSFNALMAKDSWLDNISNLPTPDNDSNGVHVHISRTSFRDDKHYSLFYFLLHKMSNVATKVGGRELTNYCKLAPNGKVHTKKKGDTSSPSGREVFLNERNEATVEARFFKSTTNTDSLKAYVQLLESLIKYTKYHATTVNVNGWFEYITKKPNKYSQLLQKVGSLDKVLLDLEVVYKEPVRKKMLFKDFPLVDIHNVVEVETKDNIYIINKVDNISIKNSSTSSSIGIVYNSTYCNNDDIRLLFSEIVSVTIEED